MAGPDEDGNEDTDRSDGSGKSVVRLQLGPNDGDAPSRVAAWRDAMAPTAELVLTPDEAEAFTAAMIARRFGDLMAVRVTTSDHRLVRTRAMAARVPLDHVLVNTTEDGRVWGRGGRRRLDVGPGAMTVQRLASPMDVRFRQATWLGLIVPLATWERAVGTRVPTDGWAYAAGSAEAVLVGGWLRSLALLPEALDAAQARRIARISLSLLHETLGSGAAGDADEPDGHAGPGAASSPTSLDQAVRQFIAANLADPALDAEAICRHFALSRTGLRRALGPGAGDVARTIRRLRLLAARRDILAASPSATGSAERLLSAIGARWGFGNERSFRRAFVREFAEAPAELRRRVRLGEVPPLPEAGAVFERWFEGRR